MFESHSLRLFLLFLATLVLGGCSGIASRMKETIAQADALEKLCEDIQSQALDTASAKDPFLIWSRLRSRLELVKKDIKDLPAVNCPGVSTENLQSVVTDLDGLIKKIGDTSNIPAFPTCSRDDTPTNNTRQCAKVILGYEESVSKKLGEVATDVHDISAKIEGIRLELENQSSAARRSVAYCAQRIPVWQGALGKIGTGLGALLTRDEAAVLEHYFASRFTTKMSEGFFDRMERLIEPIDHLLDKLDDKTYAVSTVMMTWAHNDIQDEFDRAYREFLGRVDVPGTMRFSLAKGACTRLERAPAPGQRYSQMMPYLLEAFVKYGRDTKDPLLGDVASKLAEMRQMVDDGQADSQKMMVSTTEGTVQKPETVQLLDFARYVANGTASNQRKDENAGENGNKGQSNVVSFVPKDRAVVKSSVLADCEAPSVATLESRLKCIQSSLVETQATLGESDQFRILAAAEFAARRAVTQADGSVDEGLVKRSGQLALGESVLRYQAAYASKLGGQSPASFVPSNVSGEAAKEVTGQKSIQGISQLAIQYVVSHAQTFQINVANDNRLTIYKDSRNKAISPPTLEFADNFCPALLRLHPTLRCLVAGKNYVIELDKTFPTRRWSDSMVYDRLQAIATTAKGMNKNFSVGIEGYTSRVKVQLASTKLSPQDVRERVDLASWPTKSSIRLPVLLSHCNGEVFLKESAGKAPCREQALELDGNYFLALGRAAWAAQVLERWGDGAISIASIKAKAASRAEDGNLAQDRKVRIYLMSANGH